MTDPSSCRFELLDHPADMGFRAWAPTLEGLFAECATALTSILVDIESIAPTNSQMIELPGDDIEMLLYNWLSEVLFLFDADGLLFSKYSINDIMTSESGLKLSARVHGEEFSASKHQVKTYVKAVTLHQLKVEKKENSYEAHVYVDI